jgi:hypothetical protein
MRYNYAIAIVHAKLPKDSVDVKFHGAFADSQLARNLFVAESTADQGINLMLARR